MQNKQAENKPTSAAGGRAEVELLACPFCGGKPNKPEKCGGSDERMGYNFTVSIECSGCGARLLRRSHEGKNGWCDDTGQALKEVTSAWNRRAS